MKNLIITSTMIIAMVFGWAPIGQQISSYEYETLWQGFWAYPSTGPYVVMVGMKSAADTQGVLCHWYHETSTFHDWTSNIPSQYRLDYKYTDVIGVYESGQDRLYITGYKIAGTDKGKGVIFRCNFDPQGTVTPWGFQDLTADLPYPYYQGGKASAVLSIDYSETSLDYSITGGDGMILFTPNFAQWTIPQNKPYVHDSSAWYKGGFYTNRAGIFKFTVTEDDSGTIAWTTDHGISWTTQRFEQQYTLPESHTHNGYLIPLSLPNSYDDWQWRIGIGLSMGKFTVEHENGSVYLDPPISTNPYWWWYAATGSDDNIPDAYKRIWLGGNDGGIIRYYYTSTSGSGGSYQWERQPENNRNYRITSIGGYTSPNTTPRHNWAVADTLGMFLYSEQYNGGSGTATPPSPPLPGLVRNFDYYYDPNWHGWRMTWDPPSNANASKVGAYWVCPPETEIEYWLMNGSPIPRTIYFYPWPTTNWMDARICAMRRDGECGPFCTSIWLNTIDLFVDYEATGNNNARTLVFGSNTLWSFWQKNSQIYTAWSSDTGKYWTHRQVVPSALGDGKWPAADIDCNNRPVVCWVRNIENGEQVTARIYYSRYNGLTWSSPCLLREETITGSGYLYPSISVDANDSLHVVYSKYYNYNCSWQLWHGVFHVTYPRGVHWYNLDSCPGDPRATVLSTPTIDTDNFNNRPMVVWNRPNSDTFYFGYRSDSQWYKQTLSFTGSMPSMEVVGNTAYLTYVKYGDIWYNTGSLKWGWFTPTRISLTLGPSSSPTIANNVIVWQEYVNNDWQIYYSYLTPLGWYYPSKFSGYSGLPDKVPHITFVDTFALVDWTQSESDKVVVFTREGITTGSDGLGPPSMAYNLGHETGAPILTERSGYVSYGQEFIETADIGLNSLKYRIVGLDSDYSWKVRFLVYHESNNPVACRVILNGQEFIALSVPPYQEINNLYDIPSEFIINEEIDLTIEPVSNTEVYLSGLFLYKKSNQGSGGGPQNYTKEPVTKTLHLQCNPIIFNQATEIWYSVSCQTDIQLSVYNSLGQQVVVIDKGTRGGIHSVVWRPEDKYGNRLAGGIYFLQLKTPDEAKVQKMVIIE